MNAMSDDEVLKFEITDDDLANEFNAAFGCGRRTTKEQQIYGVWALDSDEEGAEGSNRVRKQKDFSAPIGFVAGGLQQAGKKKEVQEIQPAAESPSSITIDSSEDEEQPEEPLESDTAGIRKQGQSTRTANLGGVVGTWEKHTKGIGAKLLLQMGYEPGKGLGKDLQGISAPVEATVRKGRGAIGAYGPEKAALKAKKEEERRLKEKEKEEDKQEIDNEKRYNWKMSHKVRYIFKEADDVIEEGKPSSSTHASSLSRVPVIDLTGKQKRVLSGYHALRSVEPRFEHEPRRQCSNFSVPHFTANLETMVECSEEDIIENARELHAIQDRTVVLERDLLECSERAVSSKHLMEQIGHVLERVLLLNREDTSLEDAYDVLRDLKENYPMDYAMFHVGTVAGNIVSPLVSALLAAWDALDDPDGPVSIFLKWRPLLTDEAYYALLWHHFLPAVSAAAQSWNPREPKPMLRVFQSWLAAGAASVAALQVCAARCVEPRLMSVVRDWDPTRDTQPVHQWVLPWHELAGHALSVAVYPHIRSQLGNALANWHPQDDSAHKLLAVWRDAWGSALTAMLHQHIVPKLEHCLQAAPIELVGLENTAWLWCVQWLDLLGAPTVGALAGRALLPRWLAALAAWLNTSPVHATVLNSVTQFKGIFPAEVLEEPPVRDAFAKALVMVNRSCDVAAEESSPPPGDPAYVDTEPEDRDLICGDFLATTSERRGFSELLESKCLSKGVAFVPTGKNREGRPLYKIADDFCYVIRNVIMYSNDKCKTFKPIGLDNLMKTVVED